MAKLTRVEDRPTPLEVYGWRVYMNGFIATFAAVMIGYDSAFIGTSISLASFKSEFDLTKKTTTEFNLISANIVSLYQAGFVHPPLFSSAFADPNLQLLLWRNSRLPYWLLLGSQMGVFSSLVLFSV